MALLTGAGCDMPTSLRLSAGATGSERILAECNRVARGVEQGQNIVEAGQFCRDVPPLFFYSMQLGSQRNELQDNLYGLSDMYAQQARTNQSRLQAMLLPLMLVLVGGSVGFAVVSLFMPMVSLIHRMSN
jgi:type IV pilus assembly protein PilC